MECRTGPTDWATIGARIIQTAAMAAAVHMAERVRTPPQTESERPRPDRQAAAREAERELG
jgi:hypothetical protein